jgi:hypothetical protein
MDPRITLITLGVADLPRAVRFYRDGLGWPTNYEEVRTKSEVPDVLALAERAGARIIKPAREASWGGYSGYFCDPDGHYWEVAWNPFNPLDEQGFMKVGD